MQDALKRPGFPIAGQVEPKAPEAAKGEINGIKIPDAPKPVELAPFVPRREYNALERLQEELLGWQRGWHHSSEEVTQGLAAGRPVFRCIECGAKAFDPSDLCQPSESPVSP